MEQGCPWKRNAPIGAVRANDIHEHPLQLLPRYGGGVAVHANVIDTILQTIGFKMTPFEAHVEDAQAAKGALQCCTARVVP